MGSVLFDKIEYAQVRYDILRKGQKIAKYGLWILKANKSLVFIETPISPFAFSQDFQYMFRCLFQQRFRYSISMLSMSKKRLF